MDELLRLAEEAKRLLDEVEGKLRLLKESQVPANLTAKMLPLFEKNGALKEDVRQFRRDFLVSLFRIAMNAGVWYAGLNGEPGSWEHFFTLRHQGENVSWCSEETGRNASCHTADFPDRFPLPVVLAFCSELMKGIKVWIEEEPEKRRKEVAKLQQLHQAIGKFLEQLPE
jgi:hypothetical protein